MTSHPPTLSWLHTVSRHGSALLMASAFVGLAHPALADRVHPALPWAVLLVNVGLFMQVDLRRLAADAATMRRALWGLGWVMLATPIALALALKGLPIGTDLKTGLLLYAAAPTAGSVVAVAAGMGLDVRLLMAIRLFGCVLAPASVPALLLWLQPQARIDAVAMALPLLMFVAGGAVVAAIVRRALPRTVEQPAVGSGLAVLGMAVIGIGAMQGMAQHWQQVPGALAESLFLAVAAVVVLQLAGSLVPSSRGPVAALTLGLASGHRSASLVWAAIVPPPTPTTRGAEFLASFLAMSILVSFVISWIAELALRRRAAHSAKFQPPFNDIRATQRANEVTGPDRCNSQL